MSTLRGQCLCGKVRYDVEDAFSYALNCHCSLCRRATGAAFKPFAGIGVDQISVTQGQDNLRVYGDETAHDLFCGTCGSLLYSVVRGGQYAHVSMGTLNDTPGIRPSAHIFVGSKAPWFEISDDLPQHMEYG